MGLLELAVVGVISRPPAVRLEYKAACDPCSLLPLLPSELTYETEVEEGKGRLRDREFWEDPRPDRSNRFVGLGDYQPWREVEAGGGRIGDIAFRLLHDGRVIVHVRKGLRGKLVVKRHGGGPTRHVGFKGAKWALIKLNGKIQDCTPPMHCLKVEQDALWVPRHVGAVVTLILLSEVEVRNGIVVVHHQYGLGLEVTELTLLIFKFERLIGYSGLAVCILVHSQLFLQGVLLHKFNMNKKAAESQDILVAVYGDHALAE
ncbi:hypothetical protein LAZ67_5001630 [Cordylochernes scorpioides]|uniref:Uncharacterized protein n=1 Tax=Cordylochernes scorpioides TaxID=51811 RepID=A0ABY6KFR0_9ARAC|nr:hypothetical protein LAZ67_5001630 [Cordylochernes scorpioides]